MSKSEVVVRAWRDPAFRASLSQAERVAVPESPCGVTDLCGEFGGGVRMSITASTTLTTCEGCCTKGCDS